MKLKTKVKHFKSKIIMETKKKKQVNSQWYKQWIKRNKREQNEEIRLVKMQYDRFFNYPIGKDLENGITQDKVKGYLNDAVNRLGSAKKRLDKFLATYEPNDNIRPDWDAIEKFISDNSNKINSSINIGDRWDYYRIVSDFFCDAKWCVPETTKNNDKVFQLMNIYCEQY